MKDVEVDGVVQEHFTEELHGPADGQTLTLCPGLPGHGPAEPQDLTGQQEFHSHLLLVRAALADMMTERSDSNINVNSGIFNSKLYLLIFPMDLLPGTGNMMAITMLVFSLLDTMLLES